MVIFTFLEHNESTKVYKIHRYAKLEVIVQNKAADKKVSDAAVEATKKAEDASAVQAKEKKAADAKAKADAAVTVSQKNALSKAKSYIAYTDD